MKNYNEIANCVFERRDAYVAKQKKRRKTVIKAVVPAVCCCLVLTIAIGAQKLIELAKPSDPSVDGTVEGTSAGVIEPSPEYNFFIDSLDKLNFCATKKAIYDKSNMDAMSISSLSSIRDIPLSSSNSTELDPDSTFTLTMCSYFTANIDDENGFLAKKLGGTGRVEVVITCNDFNNMITFKKDDNYYSCLQTVQTENAMTFSTAKYVDGFKLMENKGDENYEFTVYFNDDIITGINCGRYNSTSGNFKYEIDTLKMNDSLCIVVRNENSFTVEQLQMLFNSEALFVADGVGMSDGSILYGMGDVTDDAIALVNSRGMVIISNKDIEKVNALYSKTRGYCVKLDLINEKNIKGERAMKLYRNGAEIREVTVVIVGEYAFITNLNNKARVSDVFYELTSDDTSEKIGRIIDHNDFEREMSKRIEFDDYKVKYEDLGGGLTKYVYELKQKSSHEYDASMYTLTIDGIEITLPISVKDFEDKGFTVDPNGPFESLYTSPSGNKLLVYIQNKGASNKSRRLITQVSFSCYEKTIKYQEGISPTRPDFILFGGVNKDSTIDDVIASLGAPVKMYVTFTDFNQYQDAYIQLYYDLSSPKLPNAYMVLNFYPVRSLDTPSDFLHSASILVH